MRSWELGCVYRPMGWSVEKASTQHDLGSLRKVGTSYVKSVISAVHSPKIPLFAPSGRLTYMMERLFDELGVSGRAGHSNSSFLTPNS